MILCFSFFETDALCNGAEENLYSCAEGESWLVNIEAAANELNDPDTSVQGLYYGYAADIEEAKVQGFLPEDNLYVCCENIDVAIFNEHRSCFDKFADYQIGEHLAHGKTVPRAFTKKQVAQVAFHGLHLWFEKMMLAGAVFDERAYRWPAMKGHLDMLARACDWAGLDVGKPRLNPMRTEDNIAFAAAAGHLDVVVWMHEEGGFPWDPLVVEYAAEGGSVEVLKYILCHPRDCKVAQCVADIPDPLEDCVCEPKRPLNRELYPAVEITPVAFQNAIGKPTLFSFVFLPMCSVHILFRIGYALVP